MDSFSIRFLTGNPSLEAAEIEAADMADAGFAPAGLPDSPDLEREMAEAFGWDVPPTDEQAEADYAARQCDEAELLAKYPGLACRTDAELIELIADPLPFPDADEAAAAAAVLLERRWAGATR